MATALTRLALAKRLGQWSGVLAPSAITSTTSTNSDLEADLVAYIDQSWVDIQISQGTRWRWMRKQSVDTKSLTASTRVFTMANLDATARAVMPFIAHDISPMRYILLKHPTTDTIHRVQYVPYEFWRGNRDRGTRPVNKPVRFTTLNNGDLEFDPVDTNAYKINCDYITIPTEFSTDSDTPEMPIHFHQLIVWYAIVHLMGFDENEKRFMTATRQYKKMLNRLHIEQLHEELHDEYLSTSEIYSW